MIQQRLTRGWSTRRVIYLLAGLAISYQSASAGDWLPGLAGAYFAAMGLFGLGCAGGSCGLPRADEKSDTCENISFEEVS